MDILKLIGIIIWPIVWLIDRLANMDKAEHAKKAEKKSLSQPIIKAIRETKRKNAEKNKKTN